MCFDAWQRRLVFLAAVAVMFRVAAALFPHAGATDPTPLRWTMAVVGLFFLACGLWAFHESRDRASLLFALYCVASCLHWGGPAGIGPALLQNLMLGFYIVAAMALHGTLFLHTALAFPDAFRIASHRGFLAALYLPTALGALLALLLSLPPFEEHFGSIAVLALVGSIAGIVGGLFFIGRLITAGSAIRRRRRLWIVVAALLLGLAPQLVGSDWLNVLHAATPAALALALARARD